MDCWIGVDDQGSQRTVRLAGRLGAEEVPELLRACGDSGALQLDLTDLVSVDAAGLDALHRVQRRGATFIGVPGYIRLQLDSPSRHSARSSRPGQ